MNTIQKIKEKCEEEIEWAQANIDEMNLPGNPHNYANDDKIWLPCWLKAHKEILDLIKEPETVHEKPLDAQGVELGCMGKIDIKSVSKAAGVGK